MKVKTVVEAVWSRSDHKEIIGRVHIGSEHHFGWLRNEKENKRFYERDLPIVMSRFVYKIVT